MKLTPHKIPLGLKVVYTVFLGVMIPVYWINYGPTNSLYFCDVALLLALVGIWRENALLISVPAVGILIPQAMWCLDFLFQLSGGKLKGMTGYMFDETRSQLPGGISLFRGWLPFLLFYLVGKLGYDRRAVFGGALLSAALCLIAYFMLPEAGAVLPDPKLPWNVTYAFNLLSDENPQTLMPPLAYLGTWIAALTIIVYIPTHFLLKKICPPAC